MNTLLSDISISLKEWKTAIHQVAQIKKEFAVLLGNLYLIDNKVEHPETEKEKQVDYHLLLIPDCEIFRVHFPEMPALPASCCVEIAKELAEQYLNEKFILRQASDIKILKLANPNDTIQLVYELHFQKNEIPNDNIAIDIIIKNHHYTIGTINITLLPDFQKVEKMTVS